MIPPSLIAYVISVSGRSGASYTLAMRVSLRPLRRLIRKVEACARMCPPTGFFGSGTNVTVAPGSAIIWLVMKTATLYSSLMRTKRASI